jgi:hypothetical protein
VHLMGQQGVEEANESGGISLEPCDIFPVDDPDRLHGPCLLCESPLNAVPPNWLGCSRIPRGIIRSPGLGRNAGRRLGYVHQRVSSGRDARRLGVTVSDPESLLPDLVVGESLTRRLVSSFTRPWPFRSCIFWTFYSVMVFRRPSMIGAFADLTRRYDDTGATRSGNRSRVDGDEHADSN